MLEGLDYTKNEAAADISVLNLIKGKA
jgi:hypothetical protein